MVGSPYVYSESRGCLARKVFTLYTYCAFCEHFASVADCDYKNRNPHFQKYQKSTSDIKKKSQYGSGSNFFEEPQSVTTNFKNYISVRIQSPKKSQTDIIVKICITFFFIRSMKGLLNQILHISVKKMHTSVIALSVI